MNDRRIVIYGSFRFPFGDASANRVYGIARAISDAGWQVFVVGKGGCRSQDKQPDGTYIIDGVQYDSIYENNKLGVYKLFSILSGGMSYQRVWERNGIINPYAIISYSNYLSGNYWVRRTAPHSSAKFVVDVVEWYSPQEFKRGIFSFAYIDNYLGIFSYRSLNNAIVISTMLENHLSKTVENTIRIPPVVDVQTIPYRLARADDKLKLIYAGSPSKKDYLKTAIEGLATLSSQQLRRVEFHIYGLDYAELRQLMGISSALDTVSKVINVHGRVPRPVVLADLQDSDFSILLRPQMRYANAGFSSKVPESLAAGTPVILNYTSDLSMYIRDSHEGVVVRDCSADEFAAALQKILSMSRSELDAMRLAARKCAEDHFDYRNYVEPVARFLEHIK